MDLTSIEPRLSDWGYKQDDASGVWCRPAFGGIDYNDGDEIEERILSTIKATADVSLLSDELRGKATDWASLYHLSGTRANVVRPFARRLRGARVLEIGAGCGAITRYMGELGAELLALEGSRRRAEICRNRTRDLKNVSVLSERFLDFAPDTQFEVITLIGVLEYAPLFTPGDDPVGSMLARVRSLLAPGGLLILAIENKLGLKYLAGAPEDHVGMVGYGVEDRYRGQQVRTFGRQELAGYLTRAGMAAQQFWGAFPDYKFPVSMVSAAGFAAPDFDAATLAAQTEHQDPQNWYTPLFSQAAAWAGVCENGLGMDLANSFVVLAGASTAELAVGSDGSGDSLALGFSSNRKAAYCKSMLFERAVDGAIVVKTRLLQEGATPAQSGGLRHSLTPLVPYVRSPMMSAQLRAIYLNPGFELAEVVEFYKCYATAVQDLSGVGDWTTQPLPGHFLDAIPRNLLIGEQGDVTLIDTEWAYASELPFGFLLFRAVLHDLLASRIVRSSAGNEQLTLLQVLEAVFTGVGVPFVSADWDRFERMEREVQKASALSSDEGFWARIKHAPIHRWDLGLALQGAKANGERIAAQLAHVQGERDHWAGAHEALVSSTSWTLTKPVRWLAKVLRG